MADEAVEQDQEQQQEGGHEQSDEHALAQEKEEEREAAKEKIKEIEEDPPGDLEDWPDDAAKYETFGGPEGDHSYQEGPEQKLGPSSLRHLEDGSVTIEGDKVDDPDKYKGEPIPGGPTDENAQQDLTAKKIREDQGRDAGTDSEDDSAGDDEPDSEEGS